MNGRAAKNLREAIIETGRRITNNDYRFLKRVYTRSKKKFNSVEGFIELIRRVY